MTDKNSCTLQTMAYGTFLGVAVIFLCHGIHSPERHINRALMAPRPKPKLHTFTYDKPRKGQFQRNRYTLDSFQVQGVNLANYGFEKEEEEEHHNHNHHQQHEKKEEKRQAKILMSEKYKLYNDFEIPSKRLRGNEHWADLVSRHRRLAHYSLAFYFALSVNKT